MLSASVVTGSNNSLMRRVFGSLPSSQANAAVAAATAAGAISPELFELVIEYAVDSDWIVQYTSRLR